MNDPILVDEIQEIARKWERNDLLSDDFLSCLGLLRKFCDEHDLCWSFGDTRLGKMCCRIFPRDQSRKGPVTIAATDNLISSIVEAVERTKAKLSDGVEGTKPAS